MNILIIYDSVFGNTERVALAMQKSLGETHSVSAIRPDAFSMKMLEELDVLVVGSPTRAFRPTKPIVDLLKGLPSDALAQGIHTAAFDTRSALEKIDSKILKFMVSVMGYASPKIDKLLTRHGGTQLANPSGFLVDDSEGPLHEGELERAGTWIKELLEKMPKA
jgi:flavodoxin